MSGYLLSIAVGLSVVASFLSVVSLLVHWAKRSENPVTGPLEAQIQALQLAQADIVDRVDHWTRRDRTRRLREEKAEDAAPTPQPFDKAAMRARLRSAQ